MPESVMDRLNLRMSEIFGSRWTSQYPRAALDTWAKGLADMTVDQIKRGVEACIAGAMEWPPTLPEFRALCLTVQHVPDVEVALEDAMAIARRWKPATQCVHPAVWHALSQIGNFTGIPEDVLERRFRRNYEKTLQQLSAGMELSPIPQPLPKPEDVKTNYPPEVRAAAAQAGLAKLDELMGRRRSA